MGMGIDYRQEIIRLKEKGLSDRLIANSLNRRSIMDPRGGPWVPSRVSWILYEIRKLQDKAEVGDAKKNKTPNRSGHKKLSTTIIIQKYREGSSYAAISNYLNGKGLATSKGGSFKEKTVSTNIYYLRRKGVITDADIANREASKTHSNPQITPITQKTKTSKKAESSAAINEIIMEKHEAGLSGNEIAKILDDKGCRNKNSSKWNRDMVYRRMFRMKEILQAQHTGTQ